MSVLSVIVSFSISILFLKELILICAIMSLFGFSFLTSFKLSKSLICESDITQGLSNVSSIHALFWEDFKVLGKLLVTCHDFLKFLIFRIKFTANLP